VKEGTSFLDFLLSPWIGIIMVNRDSITYDEILRAYRNNIRWLGLSDSARNVMAFLLTENQWTGEPQSPEDIGKATGLARSSISAIMSQLIGLGLVESKVDTSEDVRGRRRTLHTVNRGLSGLILFGLRRLVVQLQDIVGELRATAGSTAKDDSKAQKILETSIVEAERFLRLLSGFSDQVIFL